MGKRVSALISRYGEERFWAAVRDAEVILGEDGRLAGMLKLRWALAKASVLRAIGGDARPFAPPPGLVRRGEVPDFCDELIAACALRLRLDGKVAA